MTLFQSLPILPERKSFGSELAGTLGQGAGKVLPQEISRALENQALNSRYGINLSGIRDPQLRSEISRRELERRQAFAKDIVDQSVPFESTQEDISAEPKVQQEQQIRPQQASQEPMQNEIASRVQQKADSAIQRQLRRGAAVGVVPNIEKLRETQGKYMSVYENALLNTLAKDEAGNPINTDKNGRPIFSEEEIAAARELGMNAAESLLDEGTIQRQAVQFANRLRNAKLQAESVLAPGVQRSLENLFKGNLSRTDEKKLLASASTAVKELVNLGLTGEAREALARAKWNPEQIEAIIQKASGSGFSEETQRLLKQAPQFAKAEVLLRGPRKGEVVYAKPLDVDQYEPFKETLLSILQADPSANLILLRKEFEKKGVDWQSFKQAVDEAALDGLINTRSKAYQYAEGVLEKPPLSILDRIFMSYGIGGRG